MDSPTRDQKKRRNKVLKLGILMASAVLVIGVFSLSYFNFINKSQFVTKNASSDKQAKAEIQKISFNPKMVEFGLVINKIGLEVPVVKNVNGTNKYAYNKALLSGVAHYQNTALLGEGSNTFIFGHSSTWNGEGPYAEAFSRLNNLEKDDQITVYFERTRYNYKVYEKKIVASDDYSVLEPTKTEQLTLMTCWPIGSNLKRLIIVAKLES